MFPAAALSFSTEEASGLRRGLVFVVLLALGLATGAPARATTDLVSMTGAYLASRAAAYDRDTTARADFLAQALQRLPGT